MRALRGERVPGLPGRSYLLGMAALLALGVWVAASGTWGYHGRYALAKGMGLAALGLGALALATSGIGWRRAAMAWLAGTGTALAATLILALVAPPAVKERLLAGGAGVAGLPFPRISGPFLHPNMLGDYLVVSGLLLWAVWPEVTGRARALLAGVAAALAVALVLTASTAWVGAGVAAIGVGRLLAREGRPGAGTVLRVGGVVLAGATFALLVVPVELDFLGWKLTTGAIRPAIWQSSLAPFFHSPLLGVGAAPYLAEAADPLQGGAMGLWDAHNAYLSLLGQFGLVGMALAAGAVVGVVRGTLWDAPASRGRWALLLALLAVGVNALFMASEDLRHAWVLFGLVGVWGAEGEGGASAVGPPSAGA